MLEKQTRNAQSDPGWISDCRSALEYIDHGTFEAGSLRESVLGTPGNDGNQRNYCNAKHRYSLSIDDSCEHLRRIMVSRCSIGENDMQDLFKSELKCQANSTRSVGREESVTDTIDGYLDVHSS